MQVLNQNPSATSKIGSSLPKPTLPQSITAKTNTPVKVANPIINNKQASIQENNLISKSNTLSINQNQTSATTSQVKPAIVVPPSTTPSTPSVNNPSNDKVVPTEQIGKVDKKKNDKKDKKSKKEKNVDVKADKKSAKKKIPTILGLLILIISLVAGVLLFGDGTGLFTPRATPETTPKNITVSNVTDKSFTVSFYTDEETIAFIKYGQSVNDVKQQASDDRDQLSGVIKAYRLHHLTVRGLESNKEYYYYLGTGSNTTFDNAGSPYKIKTASNPGGASPNNQTIYGTVIQNNGRPGEGAIVFVTLEGAGTLSTLVKSSGSWAVSLANAFNIGLNAYPEVNEDSALSIKVQGIETNSITNRTVTVASAQPVPEIIMGQEAKEINEDLSAAREELLAENFVENENLIEETEDESIEASQESLIIDEVIEEVDLVAETTTSNQLDNAEVNEDSEVETTTLSESDRTLDLDEMDETSLATDNVIQTTQPIIKANLPPNVTVKIEIHSDTAIETITETDANGDLLIDVASLEKNLDPGEHTINYTYIDPQTGQEVTKSYNFTVSEPSDTTSASTESVTRTIASAETTQSLPYGSGDPYVPSRDLSPTPIPVPTDAPIEEATASVRETSVSTASGTYNAGSILNTVGLLALGLFFVITGTWSFFLAKQFSKKS